MVAIAAFPFPLLLLSLVFPHSVVSQDTKQKVAGWELCAAPWYSDTGLFATTNTNLTGYNPDTASTVVRGMYACPYKEGSPMYGLWTQDCNYNLYAYRYEGKRPLTTCFNTLVVYGDNYDSKAVKPGYIPTTLTWESLAFVDYGTGASGPAAEAGEGESTRALMDDDEGEGEKRSWRFAVESDLSEWLAPKSIDYSSLHILNGAGKFHHPHTYVSNIKIDQEFTLESKGLEVETTLGVYYKKLFYNYASL